MNDQFPMSNDPAVAEPMAGRQVRYDKRFGFGISKLFWILIFGFGALAALPSAANAAVVTWDGGGADNNWSTAANWSGDTAPTSADIATFDGTSVKNATIDANITVAGIDINTGYIGIITQNSLITVTVESSNFDQAAGTFTGGDSSIDINGTFTLSSGTFTSTSGTMTVAGNFTHSGGTFTHSSGTVTIDAASTVAATGPFYNFTVNAAAATVALGAALDVNNDLTITAGTLDTDSINNYAMIVAGAWTNSGTFTSNSNTVTFDGSSVTKTITTGGTGTGNDFHSLTINGVSSNYTLSGSLDVDNDMTIVEGTMQTGKDATSNVTVGDVLNVQDGGTLIVRRSSTTSEGAGQTVTAGTLTIDSGGSLNADGEGFVKGTGPGVGASRDGGSHGGRGGDDGGNATTGTPYGSMTNPVSLGSGGGSSASAGTAGGGGAITISSTGTVTVNGTLSANGANGNSGGAGGSLNITSGTLTGSGTISANGGAETDGNDTGSGGGGRISLNGVTTDNFTGTLQANGGTVGNNGRAGTIYLNSAKRTTLTLGGAGNLTSLRLGSDGTNNYTLGTVTIQSGGTLEIDGNPAMNSNNGGAATLSLATLDIQSGGTLKADGFGFDYLMGPGNGADIDGASHGGEGGDHSILGTVTAPYGSITNPVSLGSGGDHDGSWGGGAIIISSTGAVTVNGTISANGGTGKSGGAGGTVNITANTISGSGTIRANGADENDNNATGSGGGGRVAVTLSSGTSFGSITLQALGGSVGLAGAAGTIYLKDANDATGDGELIIDNNSVATSAGTDTLISSSVTDTAVGDVTIRNAAKLQMDSGTTLTVSGNFTDNVGTTLSAGTVAFDGTNKAINGSSATTFFNLTKSVSSADTLTFPTAVTTTISNNTTLEGTSNSVRLSIRSSSAGTQSSVNIASTGTRTIRYVDVKDQNNTNATAIDCTIGCASSGNNTNWNFPWTGVVYTDEGSTNIGANKTVAVAINGGVAVTADTDSSGVYTIANTPNIGDIVTIYLDGETEQAVAVTVSNNSGGAVDLYQNRLIIRNDNDGSTTNANLATADNNGDSDITSFYSISVSDVTVAAGKELMVWSGDTYAPGGTVAADDIEVNGTFTMGANAVTATGSWDATGGTFTSSGTVTLSGTSTETVTSSSNSFNNLTISGNGGHYNLQDALDVNTLLTISSGATLDANSYGITLTGGSIANNGTLRLQGGETLTGFTNDNDSGTTAFDGTGTYSSLSGLTSFNNVSFVGAGAWTLAAAIEANGNLTISAGTLDTHATNNYGITVGGSWTNTAGTFNERSGTVTFDAAAGTNAINESGSFYHVTLNDGGGSATFQLGAALDVNGNLTITGGTVDVSANSYAVTVAGNWTNSDGFTARSGTVTFDGGSQAVAGSTTFYNLTKTVSSAATWTFTAGTTQTVANTWTAQGASGQNLSLRSSADGTQWRIDPQGTRTLAFIDIKDSNNINATTVLCSNDCVNSGNNSNWAFPISVTVYTDEGTTGMGTGKTIAISVNGGTKSTADTNSSSIATFATVGTSPGDILTMWLDDESENGVTVTVTNATTLAFAIYQDRLVLQYEQGSGITSANLDTANNVSDSDIDAIYTMSVNNLTMQNNAELYINSGDTFTLGGTAALNDIDINGTFTMGTNNVTVAGSWDATGGTFTASNTVTFNSSDDETITSNGSSFNNVVYNVESGGSVSNTDTMSISGTQTINATAPSSDPDTTAPTISSISVTAAETTATILWTTNESADSTVNYGPTSSLGSSASDTTNTIRHAVTLTGLTANTTYHYTVTSVDTSNNSASSSTNTFTTLQAGTTSDTTAPTISNVSVSDVTGSGAKVTWATNENTSTQLDYGESTSYNRGATSGSSNTLTTSHGVTLTGLAPSTTYHYRVVAIDAAGNIGTASDATLTTNSEEEEPEASEVFKEEETQTSEDAPELTTSDTITSAAPAVTEIGSTSVRVSWVTNERATTVVYYRPLNSNETPFKVGDPSFVTNHTLQLVGLKEATEYEYSVESADAEGNKLLSKRYQFTTKLPEVSNVEVSTVGATAAEFVYLTDSPTRSIIELTNLRTGETRIIELDDIVLEHKVPLSELDPNTEYSAIILVRGPDGSLSRSLAYIFNTSEDTSQPTISAVEAKSALVEGQQDTVQTIVSWTTDEITTSQVQYSEGLTQTNEYTSASEETTDYVARHIVVLPDLQPSTVYQYRVRSVDEAGNEAISEARVLLTPQRRVSAFDIIIRNLEGAFGWARNITN